VHVGFAPRMLHRREESECRFRTLVQIRAGSLQAVESTSGLSIPHEDTAVIAAKEPVGSGSDSVSPLLLAVNIECPDTRIGQCCRLNRLLIESWASVLAATATNRGDGKVSLERLSSQEPFQEFQAAPLEVRTVEG